MRRLTFLACTQVDKITYLAMGLRMLAVCNELRAHPRFHVLQNVHFTENVRFAKAQKTKGTKLTRITGTFEEIKVFCHDHKKAAN